MKKRAETTAVASWVGSGDGSTRVFFYSLFGNLLGGFFGGKGGKGEGVGEKDWHCLFGVEVARMLRGGVFRGSNGDSVLFVAGVCAGNRTRRGVRRVETKMVTSVGPDLARYSGPPGQDPKEMFDVYSPPRPDHNGFISREERGKPLMTKRRQMVHRDGDWHRSVHAWLVHPGTKSMVIQKR